MVTHIFLFVILPISVTAQSLDYNKIIIPESISNTTFEEKLIQLAWRNHPSNKVVQENVNLAQREKAIANWSWLDNIYAVGNLNEFTVSGAPTERQLFFPRYNFGMRISLGMFVKTPLESKVAESRILNSEHAVNEKKIQVRADVLIQVERLKENFKLLKLQQNLNEQYYQMYKQFEKKFQTNEITLERLQSSQENYFAQNKNLITIESKFNQEEIATEALIGVKLEDVEGYENFKTQLTSQLRQAN
jgi:outer membrane protein TolC